jgi:hypothetical protein
MRFNELSVQSIPYQETLNPLLWANNQLKTEIRYQLLLIARHFTEFLKVESMHLKDITISGSNASYGYSEFSDIDLHLVVDIPSDKPELVELYDAKKNQYNFTYNIKIKDIDVELYVQDSKQHHESAGIYSIINDNWIKEPKHQTPRVSEQEVNDKARNYVGQINQALKSSKLKLAKDTMDNIKRLRKSGLDDVGEFSVENLAFKVLRAHGKIDKLRNHINKLQSSALSLGEQHEDL